MHVFLTIQNRPVTSWDFRPRKLELLRIRFGPIPAISSTGGLRPLIYMYDYSEGREDTLYVSETDRERARCNRLHPLFDFEFLDSSLVALEPLSLIFGKRLSDLSIFVGTSLLSCLISPQASCEPNTMRSFV